jgi:hypothetical protein
MSDQSNRQAPLGENQLIVLRYLREGRGWPGHGWTFGSTSQTKRILDSLVRRGLVKVEEVPRHRHHGTYSFYSIARQEEES